MKKIFRLKKIWVGLCLLVGAIILSVVMNTRATTPNPGHPWTDIGNGNFTVANTQTATRTYNFPDIDAKILTSSSSITFLEQTVTATTTLSATSSAIIYANASSSPITIILPLASANPGTMYMVKKVDASFTNQVTIQATSTDTIDSISSISLANRGESAIFQSDGVQWRVNFRRSYDVNAYHTRGSTLNQVYTSPNIGSALINTNALTANRLYAMPLVLTKTTTIDQMLINVTTASGTVAEVGIYNDNGNEYPGTLAVDCGSVSPGTTGVKTYTTGLPITLDAGLYWMAVDGSSAFTMRQFAVAGLIPVLGYASTLPTNAQFGWYVSQVAGALPTTFAAGGTAIAAITDPIPAIFIRLSG